MGCLFWIFFSLCGMVWFESVIRWLAIIWMGVECKIDEGVAV